MLKNKASRHRLNSSRQRLRSIKMDRHIGPVAIYHGRTSFHVSTSCSASYYKGSWISMSTSVPISVEPHSPSSIDLGKLFESPASPPVS